MSSLTLPRWGCLHGGVLSEHPTPELPTVGSGCSSPPGLPTPRTSDSNGVGEHGTGGLDLRTTVARLPTPTARDSKGSDLPSRRGGPSLPALLATPSVVDMGSAYSPEEWEAWRQEQRRTHANGNGHGESLTQQAIAMLPTPKAADGERGRDVARARPDEKSRELATVVGLLPGHELLLPGVAEALSIGASTDPRSDDGSASSDDQHPHLPFPEPLDATD